VFVTVGALQLAEQGGLSYIFLALEELWAQTTI